MIDVRNLSPAQRIAMLPKHKRDEFFDKLSPEEKHMLLHDWQNFLARPVWQDENGFYHGQLFPQPMDWTTWLVMAGRGFGKTRIGAESVKYMVDNGYRYVSLLGKTNSDVRNVMINGESGIMSLYKHLPQEQRPRYLGTKIVALEWPNGAIGIVLTASEPEGPRGTQSDLLWCDEFASYSNGEAYENAILGNRLSSVDGKSPKRIITTTPKPVPHLIEVYKSKGTVVTIGSTFENAPNIASSFISDVREKYEGTTLGRQELYAELLLDVDGALFRKDWIERARIKSSQLPNFVRIVIGVDPAASVGTTGIVVVGLDNRKHLYVLDDCSTEGTPKQWVNAILEAYYRWKADAIIAETNQGGDMVVDAIANGVEDGMMPRVINVKATRSKGTRAEPISPLYEQGRVHHVGWLGDLESQMLSYDPNSTRKQKSDRLDALVWAATELTLNKSGGRGNAPILIVGRVRR